MHGRSRMTIDPRISTIPGRRTLGFHRRGRRQFTTNTPGTFSEIHVPRLVQRLRTENTQITFSTPTTVLTPRVGYGNDISGCCRCTGDRGRRVDAREQVALPRGLHQGWLSQHKRKLTRKANREDAPFFSPQ